MLDHCHLWEVQARMCSLLKTWGNSSWGSSAKLTRVGGRLGHPSAVCIWMGTSPRALQASSPSCQLLPVQGRLCSAIEEPRDLREVGMREEGILTRGWPRAKRHRAVLTPHKAGGRKQCLCLPGAGRAAGAEQTACRPLLLPPTPAGNTACLSHPCWGPCGRDTTPLCQGLCFGP